MSEEKHPDRIHISPSNRPLSDHKGLLDLKRQLLKDEENKND